MIKDIINDLLQPFVLSLGSDWAKQMTAKNMQSTNQRIFADTYLQNNILGYSFSNLAHNLSFGTQDDEYCQALGVRGGLLGFLEIGNYWDLRVNIPYSTSSTSDHGLTLTSDSGLFYTHPAYGPSLKFFDSSNVFIERASSINNDRVHPYHFSLTSEYGITAGGKNQLTPYTAYNTCERYSDSGNLWISRAGKSTATGNGGSISLTTDLGLASSGMLTSGYTTISERYSNSANTWVNRTVSYGASEPRGGSINSNSGIICGGLNSSYLSVNYKYCDLQNTFSATTAMLFVNLENTIFTLSDQAVVSTTGCPDGVTSIDKTTKFMANAGYWQMLLNSIVSRDDTDSISLTANKGIITRGHQIPTVGSRYETCRYNHFMSPVNGTSIFDFFNTAFCGQDINCPHPADKQIYVQTINLVTQKFPIDSVLAYCGSVGSDNTPSISVSLDGGKTYKDDQVNGTIINTDGLKLDVDGNYKLKLKFQLPVNGNSWINKTNLISARTTMGGLFLNNDQSLVAGGLNASSGARTAIGNTDRYSSSQDSWLNRTSLGSSKWDGYFITLGWDCGLYCGGGNGVTVGGLPTGVDLQTQRYSNSQNNWIQKTDLITAVLSGSTISLTNNLGIFAGGTNSTITWCTGSTNLYNHSLNTWTVQTSLIQSRYNCPGMTLTDGYGLVAGGVNSSGLSTTEAFIFSTGTWISKLAITYISPGKNNFGTIDLTTDSGLIAGGSNTSGYDYNSIKYFYNSNYWTARLNITKITNEPANFGQTTYTGILAGGYNGTGLLQDSQQYCNGDLDFLGFIAIPISKK